MNRDRFISCGMYAFNADLRQAWQSLFDGFAENLATKVPLSRALIFDGAEAVLRDPALLFGHTCGYPLMISLRDALKPFCVPVFEIEGCRGPYYSSRIIVHADSSIDTLEQTEGGIVAVNHIDSNSGMNLLRNELVKRGVKGSFFGRVDISGGHLQSLQAVADKRADVAAIDCVSYQLIADYFPQTMEQLRSIGFTDETCGLPFVMPNSSPQPATARDMLAALEKARRQTPGDALERLHLIGFHGVELSDYDTIDRMRQTAIDQGYAELK